MTETKKTPFELAHPKVHEPFGLGVYYRDIDGRDFRAMAQVARDHGVRVALLLAAWQEVKRGKYEMRIINRTESLIEAANEFERVGVKTALWFYPWAGHEQELLEHLGKLILKFRVYGLLNDAELGCKWKRKGRKNKRAQQEAISGRGTGEEALRRRQAVDLMEGLLDLMFENMWMGTTAYGIARYHPNFPWREFLRYGCKSPQLYGSSQRDVNAGMKEWAEHANDPDFETEWVPSVGLYGDTDEGLLLSTLQRFNRHKIQGMFAWSEPQISRREWALLEVIAEQWGWV